MTLHVAETLAKAGKWIGPGFLVAVAYIDPGNYSTDIAAGASTGFRLLFIVLLSNIFAVLLQSLAIRLGTITGKDLGQNCRDNLPTWLNLLLYIFAESAAIATDVAEVIGSAIAINLLIPTIPLVACCAITFIDVLFILFFYNPDKGMRGLRYFEYFVVGLVLAVVICFCILLAKIPSHSVGEVFLGYLPSSAVVTGNGLYLSCGILGATVMPHSLYLGSGIVQPRVREYEAKHPELRGERSSQRTAADGKPDHRPSLPAIQHCLKWATVELVLSLCVFALFVNSAILVVAGASLSGNDAAATDDLFGIFALLTSRVSRGAGIVFAVALLFSGTSAGIVCTIAGQMISEGHFNWTIAPWKRRLLTRLLSITPSIIIAGAVGREGLSAALNASQVVLSVLLPFISAPLVWFTALNRYMMVETHSGVQGGVVLGNVPTQESESAEADNDGVTPQPSSEPASEVGMRNHLIVSILAVMIWLVITIMDITVIVFLALGQG